MDKLKLNALAAKVIIIPSLLFLILFNACSHNNLTTNQPKSLPNKPNKTNPSNTIDPQLQQSIIINTHNAANLHWIADSHKSGEANAASDLIILTSKQIVIFSSDLNAITYIDAERPSNISFSEASQSIAWLTPPNSIHIWDLITQREILTIQESKAFITSQALSNRGDKVAYSTTNNLIYIRDILGDTSTQTLRLSAWVTNLKFSENGELLSAVDLSNFGLLIFELTSGKAEKIREISWVDKTNSVLTGAHLSPDWKQIAWVSRNAVQIMDVETAQEGPSLYHEDSVSAIAWSPDGKIIASSAAGTIDNRLISVVYLWDSNSGELVKSIKQKDPVIQISFSPDGDKLALLSSSGMLEIWQTGD